MILREKKNCLKNFCSAFAVLLALLTLALPVHTVFGADNIPVFRELKAAVNIRLSTRRFVAYSIPCHKP